MNIGETIDAQNRAILKLQNENAVLTHQLTDCKKYLDKIMQQGIELKTENIKLANMAAKAMSSISRGHRQSIECGIGELAYTCNGSIDLIELMNELEKVIKNNGVRNTIRILAMAV